MWRTEQVEYKLSIELVRQLLQFGRKRGLPIDELMAQHGLQLAPLPGQPAYMSGVLAEKMLLVGMQQIPDPLPGLYISRWQLSTLFGLASVLVQTSATVGSVIETMQRVEPLIGNTGATRLRHAPGVVEICWDCRFTDPHVRMHAADFILATIARGMLTAAAPGMRVIDAVHFRHDPPEDVALIQRYMDIFGCPVYFNQPENKLVVPIAILDLSLPSADPVLHEVLEQHARRLIAERNSAASFADLARSHLHRLLHKGAASRENLADAMGMVGRTLHRKLGEAGTSYRQILDEIRLESARTLLRDDTLTIVQIAERAGFEDSSSFTRWFRQLTGMLPSEFRLAHRDTSA